MTRYARQNAVPGFGREGTQALESARVLVIGAGGLAVPVLQYLVGGGVGFIRLVDPDVVALSNLHRQTLFNEQDIDQSKAQTAAQRLRQLNHHCKVEALQMQLDPSNVSALCAGIDLVLDCADSFAASYIASDFCFASDIPLISASVVGTDGYCGGFCAGAPSLRAVFPDLPERLGSCDSDGVLGAMVGVIGSLQAQMAISVIANLAPNPLGQLLRFDAGSMRFSQFRFDQAPEPETGPAFISVDSIRSDDFLVDLRAVNEAGPGLSNARRVSVAEVAKLSPQDGQRVVFACRSGLRAWQAAENFSQIKENNVALLALGDGAGSIQEIHS